MLESSLEQLFRRLVRKQGAMTFKLSPTIKGIPDRCVIKDGRTHFVELKQGSGKLSPAQVAYQRKMKDVGGVEVITLYGEEQVRKWVSKL